MATEKKIHTNFYVDPKLHKALIQRAKNSGQSISWEMENILAVAIGLREWPKPPKGMKKAKELTRQ